MGKYVEFYCSNENKELKRISNPILRKFWSLSQADYDDFYSIAAETVWSCEKEYDESYNISFEGFLRNCLNKKFATGMTFNTRDKRCNTEKDKKGITKRDTNGNPIVIPNTSLDIPITEDGLMLADIIPGKMNVETEVLEEKQQEYSDRMMKYLNKLSDLQLGILKLTVAGYSSSEIIEELHITNREYINSNIAIHSYRNTSILF